MRRSAPRRVAALAASLAVAAGLGACGGTGHTVRSVGAVKPSVKSCGWSVSPPESLHGRARQEWIEREVNKQCPKGSGISVTKLKSPKVNPGGPLIRAKPCVVVVHPVKAGEITLGPSPSSSGCSESVVNENRQAIASVQQEVARTGEIASISISGDRVLVLK